MQNKGRGDDGRYTPEVTDAELLAAVRSHEPAATSEVASEVDMTRQGVDRRLRSLRDDGWVNSKKIGASLVWFAPDAGADSGDAGRDDKQATRDGRESDRERVAALDLQGRGSRLEARQEALVAILARLREGPAEKGELVTLVEEYEHGYSDAESFFSNMSRQDVWGALGVETSQSGTYYYPAGDGTNA